MLTILLLAAGAAARMRGEDKLLQEVDGVPLVRLMATRAVATGCPVVVALPPAPGPRDAALAGLAITPCHVADAVLGMAHSIRAGVASLPRDCAAVMILPADMVELDKGDLDAMIGAWANHPEGTLLRGTSDTGQPGHPVIFPRSCFAALSALSGDTGARDLLRVHAGRVARVGLPGRHALTDLDTPEDWAAWRTARGKVGGSGG